MIPLRRTAAAAAALSAAIAASGARAADIRFDGSYRLRLDLNSDLFLDEQPTRLGQKQYAEHRLRLTPKIVEEGQISIQAEFDVLSGLIAGDLAPGFAGLGYTERSQQNGIKATGFDFRHVFVTLRSPVGQFQLGQMPSHWGMGLVANDGEGEDNVDFGDVRFGDIVERVQYATRPLGFLGPRSGLAQQVVAVVAGDIVYRDRFAQLIVREGGGGLHVGDVALQAVGALRWDPTDTTRAGAYVVRRTQTFDQNGGGLHLWIFDGYLRTQVPLTMLSSDLSLALELEGAAIVGGSSHGANLSAPGDTALAQQGGAGRLRLNQGGVVETELEVGYASGDANPLDGQGTGFSMSRDYKVSLVLFDEVMLFQTQNAARRLADPALGGGPPAGLDVLPTQGAVTDALYGKLTLRVRPPFLDRRLRVVLAGLKAHAPQPVVDPYNTLLASAPRNFFGARPGSDYGWELDGAVSYLFPFGVSTGAGLELGLQAGALFPGDVFTRTDGSIMPRASATKLRATVTF